MEGISVRALLWRCFSSFVILLYLVDERTSLLVSLPAAFGLLVELWKLRKALKFNVLSIFPPRFEFGGRSRREAETEVLSAIFLRQTEHSLVIHKLYTHDYTVYCSTPHIIRGLFKM